MECQICSLLEEDIRRAMNDPELKKSLEAQLEAHWMYQEEFRAHYASTVSKAITNDYLGDLAIHIDAGTLGSEYSPYYYVDMGGEPEPHKCCKVKNVFVQIHGWGLLVFQLYPHFEEMSANHVVEVKEAII